MRLKQTILYKEARHIWRAFFVFGHGFSYLYHRFIIGSRIRSLGVTERPVETNEYSVHILCSHKDLTMMMWSLASWYNVLPSGMAGKIYVHEDGSFTNADKKLVRRILSHAQIVNATDSDSHVGEWLANYPETKKFRLRADIPLMRKLIDPYFTGDAAYKLILDSDIVWFKEMPELIECINNKKACAALSNTPMKGSVVHHLPEEKKLLNSGIIGYALNDFSLEGVERYLGGLGSDFFGHHVEQAGYAFALNSPSFLPYEKYSLKEKTDQVMWHFTGPDRERYWFEGVRRTKYRIL